MPTGRETGTVQEKGFPAGWGCGGLVGIPPGFGRAALGGCRGILVGQHLCPQKWLLTQGTTPATNGLWLAPWRRVETQSAVEVRPASPTGLCWQSVEPRAARVRMAPSPVLLLWCAGPPARRPAPACCAQPGAELGSRGSRGLGPGTSPRPAVLLGGKVLPAVPPQLPVQGFSSVNDG